jgi:hypothetical protein
MVYHGRNNKNCFPPKLVSNWQSESMAKVVPNDVDDNAAPAANAVNFPIFIDVNRGMRRKGNAIGGEIRVIAIKIDEANI